MKRKETKVLCPKCGEFGYWGYGWTASPRDKVFQIQYVRHYSSEVFQRQMVRYRNHELKSRPNGQKRCYMGCCYVCPLPNTDYWVPYCRYDPHLDLHTEKAYRPHRLESIPELTDMLRARRRLGLVGAPFTRVRARTRTHTPPKPTRPLPPQERPLPLAVRAAALLHDTEVV